MAIKGMKREGNVSIGRRDEPLQPLFNEGVTPAHPRNVLFVATAAPMHMMDLEFRVTKVRGGLEISGPGIQSIVVPANDIDNAKLVCKMLAQAFDAGRGWVTSGF